MKLILIIFYSFFAFFSDIPDFYVLYSILPVFTLLDEKKTCQTPEDSQLDIKDISKVSAVIVYNNADTDKSQILLDNKGKTGVYMWTHIETGKIYVGSAIDLSKRLSLYFIVSWLKQKNYYISRALLHHTHSAFFFIDSKVY
jgi:hypothetical protein